jgi:flagellar biosynthesis protein FlhF
MAMAVSDHAQLRQALSESLSQKLKFEPIDAAPTRPVVLVGPPGAGKTAAVAKLATRALAVGYEALLISVDSERCGGAEQLRAMADRLGTPFETATTLQELSRLTKKARQAGQCVFVDAASASPMQPSDMRATERLVQEVGLEPILCMPADLRYEDLEDLGLAYAEIGTKRAIATRFDLTKRRASAVFALHKTDIALAQISATPFITGGIALASAHRVAALLLEPFDDIKAEDAA